MTENAEMNLAVVKDGSKRQILSGFLWWNEVFPAEMNLQFGSPGEVLLGTRGAALHPLAKGAVLRWPPPGSWLKRHTASGQLPSGPLLWPIWEALQLLPGRQVLLSTSDKRIRIAQRMASTVEAS